MSDGRADEFDYTDVPDSEDRITQPSPFRLVVRNGQITLQQYVAYSVFKNGEKLMDYRWENVPTVVEEL